MLCRKKLNISFFLFFWQPVGLRIFYAHGKTDNILSHSCAEFLVWCVMMNKKRWRQKQQYYEKTLYKTTTYKNTKNYWLTSECPWLVDLPGVWILIGLRLTLRPKKPHKNYRDILFAGHRDRETMRTYVCGLHPRGQAFQDGRLKPGDQLLKVTTDCQGIKYLQYVHTAQSHAF